MERICAFDECGLTFQARTHNQKYCSTECCRLATNKRLMVNYYEGKERRRGRIRQCTECGARLSQYNKGKKCQSHDNEKNNRADLLALFGDLNGN